MSLYEVIIQMTQSIPQGSVMSYKSIASVLSDLAGEQVDQEVISDTLLTISEDQRFDIPRWRVVAHDGRVVSMDDGILGLAQIRLLEDEGIVVSEEGYVDMSQYQGQRQ